MAKKFKESKKTKKEVKKDVFPLEQEIMYFQSRYPSIVPAIDSTIIRQLYEEAIQEYMDSPSEISQSLTINFSVEKKFFLALRDLVLAGDIDLEIAIVEQFMPTGRMLIKKLGYKGDDLEQKVELAITNSIEEYQGLDGFNSTVLKELKKMIKPVVVEKEIPVEVPTAQNVPVEVNSTPDVAVDVKPIEHQVEPVPEKGEAVMTSISLEDTIKNILQDRKRTPVTSLEQLLRDIDILRNSPLDDENYVKFLSLKYGYCDNHFLSLEEIAEILNLSKEVVKSYYLQSLEYVKNWFGLQLDKYYTYQKKANE